MEHGAETALADLPAALPATGAAFATKRRPEQRPVRIAEMIRLLEEGKKER